MLVRVLRPAISLTVIGALLLAALAAFVILGAEKSHADSSYTPVTSAKYCNDLPTTFSDAAIAGAGGTCTEDLSTGAAADFYTDLDMLSPTNLNFSSVITFAPSASTINGGGTIATGAKIGGLSSTTTLGLINGLCATTITVEFVFYNVALPDNLADPRASTNIAWPRFEGSSDRFGGLETGTFSPPGTLTTGFDGDHSANAGKGHFAIAGSGTSPDSVPASGRSDGASLAINNYPIWLLDLFDPDYVPGNFDPTAGPVTGSDGATKPIVPVAVYGGMTFVAGSWTPLYFVQFAPGALTALGGVQALMNASMGWPSVSVLTDPTAVASSPSTITDFCTPLEVETTLLGTAIGGGVRATNPATAGTHFVGQYNASQRDLDQDGFETSIDTCFKDVSTSPRVASGSDADGDGIDDVCDAVGGGAIDEDGDGFLNRQDNCSVLANPSNLGSEVNVSIGSSEADLGPKGDGIGDACDTGGVTVAAGFNGSGSYSLTLSPTVSNGRYHVVHNLIAKCFGGLVDGDGDGYCATPDGDSFGFDVAADPESIARHNKWAGAHPALQADTDGDGFSDAAETYLKTDPVFACSATSTNTDEPVNHWPLDLTDNRIVNTLDVAKFVVPLNNYVGEPTGIPGGFVSLFGHELDLNFDGKINTLDVAKYVPFLNDKCSAAFGSPNAGYTAFADALQ